MQNKQRNYVIVINFSAYNIAAQLCLQDLGLSGGRNKVQARYNFLVRNTVNTSTNSKIL